MVRLPSPARPIAPAIALSILALCVAALAVPSPAAGTLLPAQSAPILGMRHHTCADCVISLAVTEDTVWAGTMNAGVVRHPYAAGGDVTAYSVEEGLGGRGVYLIDAATDGHVWAAHHRDVNTSPRTGISHFDGQSWEKYDETSGLPDNRVNDIEALPGGEAWVATADAFAHFDGSRWVAYAAADIGLRGEPLTVAVTPEGTVYAGTSLGLVRFDGAAWTEIPVVDLPTEHIWDLGVDGEGHVWAMQAPGVAELDPAAAAQPAWTFHDIGLPDWDPSQGWRRPVTDRLYVDDQDRVRVVVGTTAYVREGGAWSKVDTATDWVIETGFWQSMLAFGPSGTMWLGLLSEGLAMATDSGWQRHLVPDRPTGFSALSVEAAPGGALWFGFVNYFNDDNILNRHEGDGWERIDSDDGLPLGGSLGICRRCLDVDDSGRVWVASSGAPVAGGWVARRDGTTWRSWTAIEIFGAEVEINAVAGDHRGGVWVGSAASGAAHLEGTRWTRYAAADGLVSDNVTAIAVQPDGTVWFGSAAGASRFAGGAWQTFTDDDGLGADQVRAIEIEPGTARVWFAGVAGEAAGVTSFDGTTWTSYGASEGLTGAAASGLAFRPDGGVWAAVEGTPDRPAGAARLAEGRWTMIRPADGLISGIAYDVAVDAAANVWVGTGAGITEILLEAIPATVTPPTPPTPVPTATAAPDEPIVCPQLQGRAPQAAIDAAVADPPSVAGWLQPQDPGKPPGRFNPLRRSLGLSRTGSPYHPLFNPLEWKVGCP